MNMKKTYQDYYIIAFKHFLFENNIVRQYYRDYRLSHNLTYLNEHINQSDFQQMLLNLKSRFFNLFNHHVNEMENLIGNYSCLTTWSDNDDNRDFWLKYYNKLIKFGKINLKSYENEYN